MSLCARQRGSKVARHRPWLALTKYHVAHGALVEHGARVGEDQRHLHLALLALRRNRFHCREASANVGATRYGAMKILKIQKKNCKL